MKKSFPLAALSALIASAGISAAIVPSAPMPYQAAWLIGATGPRRENRAGKRYGASVRQHQRKAAKARNRAASR